MAKIRRAKIVDLTFLALGIFFIASALYRHVVEHIPLVTQALNVIVGVFMIFLLLHRLIRLRIFEALATSLAAVGAILFVLFVPIGWMIVAGVGVAIVIAVGIARLRRGGKPFTS